MVKAGLTVTLSPAAPQPSITPAMTAPVIPPSPSREEYAEQYAAALAANGDETIFDRAEPVGLFIEWLADARTTEPNDPNAMALSTVDANGGPDSRMVLLKDVDARGFTFYSNRESAKGDALAAHPAAALPEYTEETNLRGPRLVLEALVRHRVPRFVYASSLRVYGRPLPPVVHEDLPYGRLEDLAHLSKVYAEKLIEMYAWRHGLRARVVRLGLVYGLSPVMKEDPRFMTAPNRFCWQAVRGEPLVVSAEGEWPTGLIAVADAVQALRLAADLAPDEPYLVVNAAPEVATIGEVAQQVAATRAALDRVAMDLIAAGLEQCVRLEVQGKPHAQAALRKLQRTLLMLR